MNRKLFTTYDSVLLPSYIRISNVGGDLNVQTSELAKLALTIWPDGRPCTIVNYWLTDQALNLTGDSITTYASQLTHLIKFCHNYAKNFHELHDQDIFDFVREMKKPKTLAGKIKISSNNQIRQILKLTLRFLMWFQNSKIYFGKTVLIGTVDINAQITITWKHSSYTQARYIHHMAMPSRNSPIREKSPISNEVITSLENCISIDSTILNGREAPPRLKNYITDYLYERRTFCLWIFKRSGLRPAELTEIPVDENRDHLAAGAIFIPTKKTRNSKIILRTFYLSMSEGSRVARYLRARSDFLANIRKHGGIVSEPNMFLLTNKGQQLNRLALTKEFQRLVTRAGYINQKVCMSMFRHPFITKEIQLYLKEFSRTQDKYDFSDEVLFQSILKRIATKTGHKSIRSLWSYINLAINDLFIFAEADELIAQNNLYTEGMQLSASLRRTTNFVARRNKGLADEILTDLNNFEALMKRLFRKA